MQRSNGLSIGPLRAATSLRGAGIGRARAVGAVFIAAVVLAMAAFGYKATRTMPLPPQPSFLEAVPIAPPQAAPTASAPPTDAGSVAAALDLPSLPEVPEPTIELDPADPARQASAEAGPAASPPVPMPQPEPADPRGSYTSSLPVRPPSPQKTMSMGVAPIPPAAVPALGKPRPDREAASKPQPSRPSLRRTTKPAEPFLPDYLRPSGAGD
jgi:hypothetical protein